VISGAKAALREAVLLRRDALPERERALLSGRILRSVLDLPAYQDSGVVLAYASFGTELRTEEFLRRVLDDRVRVADVELERGAAQGRAVADALNLEAALEALRDALDHVRDQRSRQPVQRAVLPALGRARDDDLVALTLDLHPLGHGLPELAERAVDHDAARVERDADAGGHGDGFSADSRHGATR